MPLLDKDCYPKPGTLFTLDVSGYIWPTTCDIHSFNVPGSTHRVDSGDVVMFVETVTYRKVLKRNGYDYDNLEQWDRDADEQAIFWSLLVGEKTTYLSFTSAVLNLTAVNRSVELPQKT